MPRIVSRVRSKVKHQLRKLRRRTADKGLAMRCQVVLLWAEGETRAAVARGVGCSPSWVGRVVRRFRDHGVAGLHDRREDNGRVKLDEAFLAMAFKLAEKAQSGWRKLNGSEKLKDLIDGVVFVDGERKKAA